MDGRRNQMSPGRLCEAAEAALEAALEFAAHTRGPVPYPADIMGHEKQPAILSNFTMWEIEQASEFLVRLGEIAPRQSKKVA